MKYMKHIEQDFYFVNWVMPYRMDLDVLRVKI